MSYYATFKPNEESAEKLKPWVDTGKANEWIADAKNEIIVKCMTMNDGKDVQKTSKELRFSLGQILKCAEAISRNGSYEQYKEDKTVWFCGWEYSRPYDAPDMKEVEDYVVKELLLLTFVVRNPDYFEEGEIFYEKVSEINDKLEYFLESAITAEDFKTMEELKEFAVGEDSESDEGDSDEDGKQDTVEEEVLFDKVDDTHTPVETTVEDGQPDTTETASPKQVPSWFSQTKSANLPMKE